MKRCLILLLFACVIQAAATAQALQSTEVDRIIQEALRQWEVPGAAVAVVRNDEVTYLRGWGVKRLGNPDPITPDSIFAIGSTTKAFVTTSIAMLVDEGKMRWDDPVRKYVTYFQLSDPLADSQVTLRDTVSHRTGLSRNDLLWYGSPWNREEIIRKIGSVRLNRPFRSTYQYQNIMFLAAGEAVASAAKTTWEDFVQKRIFEPLGMRSANFSTLAAQKSSDQSTPHTKDRSGVVKPISWRNIDNVGPAGAINASARDLAQWVRFQLGDGTFEGQRLLSQANLKETHTPQTVIRIEGPTRAFNPHTNLMSYGLGWTIQDYHGRLVVSHGGRIDGFSAKVTLLPKENLGIVFLCNRGATQADSAVTFQIVDHILDLPPTDWNAHLLREVKRTEDETKKRREERLQKRQANTRTSRELVAYTGTYEDPGYGTAEVRLENGALILRWSNFNVPLEHYHYDTFFLKEQTLEDELVLFGLNREGEISTLSFLDVTFTRVKPKELPAASPPTR